MKASALSAAAPVAEPPEYRLYQLNPPVTLGLPCVEEWVLYDDAARRVSIRYWTRQSALDAWINRTIEWETPEC